MEANSKTPTQAKELTFYSITELNLEESRYRKGMKETKHEKRYERERGEGGEK